MSKIEHITVKLTGGDYASPRGEHSRRGDGSMRTPIPSGATRCYAALAPTQKLQTEIGANDSVEFACEVSDPPLISDVLHHYSSRAHV